MVLISPLFGLEFHPSSLPARRFLPPAFSFSAAATLAAASCCSQPSSTPSSRIGVLVLGRGHAGGGVMLFSAFFHALLADWRSRSRARAPLVRGAHAGVDVFLVVALMAS
jgi:hypothetical protein